MPTNLIINAFTKAYPSILNRIQTSIFDPANLETPVVFEIDQVVGHPKRTWIFEGLERKTYILSVDEIDSSGLFGTNLARVDVTPNEFGSDIGASQADVNSLRADLNAAAAGGIAGTLSPTDAAPTGLSTTEAVPFYAKIAGTYTNLLDSTGTAIVVGPNDGEVKLVHLPPPKNYWEKISSLRDMTTYSLKTETSALATVVDLKQEQIDLTYAKPLNIFNAALAVKDQIYDTATLGFITSSGRAHTGLQLLDINRDNYLNNVTRFAIQFAANGTTPVAYMATAPVTGLNSLGAVYTAIVDGTNYDAKNYVLKIRGASNAKYVTGNNARTTYALSTTALFDTWRNSVELNVYRKDATTSYSVAPTKIQETDKQLRKLFPATDNLVDPSLGARGQVWSASINGSSSYVANNQGLKTSVNRGNSGFQIVPGGTLLRVGKASRAVVVYENVTTPVSANILMYYAEDTNTTFITQMGTFARKSIVLDVDEEVDGNYDTKRFLLTILTPGDNTKTYKIIYNDPDESGWELTTAERLTIWAQAMRIMPQRKIGTQLAATAIGSGLRRQNPRSNILRIHHRCLHETATVSTGNASAATENTIPGATLVEAMGGEMCEIDCQTTSDGIWVVNHDDSMNRTYRNNDATNTAISGTVNIIDNTLANLKANYRSYSTVSEKFRQPIPTLREFCMHCKKIGIKIMIEPKVGTMTAAQVDSFLAIIRETIGLQNVIVYSGDFSRVRMIRDKDQSVYLIKSAFGATAAEYDLVQSIGNCGIMLDYNAVVADPTIVSTAVSKDLDVYVFTVPPADMNKVINLGVYGILSDYIAPVKNKGTHLLNLRSYNDFTADGFTFTGTQSEGIMTLSGSQTLTHTGVAVPLFCAAYVGAYIKGTYSIAMTVNGVGVGTVTGTNTDYEEVVIDRHMYNKTGNFVTTFSGTCTIMDATVELKKF